MAEIVCPNCGTVVPVDDFTYANIVRQVRDSEFERELASRQDLAVKTALSEQKLAFFDKIHDLEAKLREAELLRESAGRDVIASLELEIAQMKAEHESMIRAKDAEIAFYRDFKARQKALNYIARMRLIRFGRWRFQTRISRRITPFRRPVPRAIISFGILLRTAASWFLSCSR